MRYFFKIKIILRNGVNRIVYRHLYLLQTIANMNTYAFNRLTICLVTLLFTFTAVVHSKAETDLGLQSSSSLISKAWEALTVKNYKHAIRLTDTCIELYEADALKMQAQLKTKASEETASEFWALNDVGTCFYIRGQAYEGIGKPKEAIANYKTLVTKFKFSQIWDDNGWFWLPADAAQHRIQILEFDSL